MAMREPAQVRLTMGWDEIVLDGEAPEGAIAMSWRGAEGARKAAALGHDAIMCPHTECYFDYDQGLRDDPAAYPWFSCLLPWERVYAFDPLAGIPPEQTVRILGAECCNWTEFTCNETELQWKMWPRTCATAEVFWSPAAGRDYGDFLRRMERHRRRLVAAGVNCAPLR